jgi:hypothetical protein
MEGDRFTFTILHLSRLEGKRGRKKKCERGRDGERERGREREREADREKREMVKERERERQSDGEKDIHSRFPGGLFPYLFKHAPVNN